MQEHGPRPPDPRRLRIERLLRERIGRNSSQFFLDGSRLADGEVFLDTAVHLIGHCAREIESAVREVAVVLLVDPERLQAARDDGRREGATHQAEVRAIIEAIGLPEDSEEGRLWLDLAAGAKGETKGFAAMTHRRAHEPAPPVDDNVRDLWRRFEELIVVLLRAIETRFAALLPTLRELAAQESPGPAALGTLRELPNTYVTRREFFENASGAWFPVLDEAGMFDPPEPVPDPETGTMQLQHWPAADYLARMAAVPEHQERFLAIVGRVDVPHEFAARALLLGAGALTTDRRARYAAELTRWISAEHHLFLITNDVADFAATLARDGQPAAVAAVLEATLALEPDPETDKPRNKEDERWFRPRPRARLENYDYEHVVERSFPALIECAPESALDVAMRLTDRALALSERREYAALRTDTSGLWFPSVAVDPERYGGHDHAGLLAPVVRDAAIAVVRRDPAKLDEVLARLHAARWPLLRRIAVHLLNVVGDLKRIRDALLDPELLEADWPEYRALSREHFGKLSEEDRREHVRMIEARKPRETYSDGSPIDPVDSARWLEAWRRGHLREIGDALPADLQEQYAEILRAEPGPPPVEAATSYLEPLDADALPRLTDEAIVEHLRAWRPSGRHGGPTVESQAGSLRGAVVREPARFAAAAESFIGLDPTYVRNVLWGLEEAVEKSRATFDWEPVLALASWALEQRIGADENRPSFDHDPGWTWTRKEIADLMRAALDPAAPRVPLAHRQAIWQLIETLAGDVAGGAADDDEDARDDALGASLNSTHGAAIHAAIEYVQWVLEDDFTRPAMEVAPEAAALLERHLDPAVDRTAATRGAIGSRIGQLIALDRGWVDAQRGRLFPPGAPPLARMTWSSYVIWNRPRRDVLVLLRDQYVAATAQVREDAPRGGEDPDTHLVEHLLMAYVRGWLPLDDDLMRTFYVSAPARLRAHATEYVGRILQDSHGQLDEEHCERMRALWAFRRAELEHVGDSERRAELENFGWWFRSGECGDDWLMTQLLEVIEVTGAIDPDSLVMDRLAELAAARPLETVAAVDLLTVQPKRKWFVQASFDEIRTVLRAGLADTSARERAIATTNRLIADGHRGLEELL